MKKLALEILVSLVCISVSAGAATLVIDTDRVNYQVGDDIDITATLTLDANEPVNAIVCLLQWNSGVADANLPNNTVQTGVISAFNGALLATLGPGTCIADDTCPLIDQILSIPSVPVDPGVVTAEVTIVATASTEQLLPLLPDCGAGVDIQESFSPRAQLANIGAPVPDTDGDGVVDPLDICSDEPLAPFPLGCDADMDGYGNACDGDLNNDTGVNGLDFAGFVPGDPSFLECFVAGSDPLGAGCDINCDGVVNGLDFSNPTGPDFIEFFVGGSPGPSGLPCAGTIPCPPN